MNLTITQIGATAWRFEWEDDGNSPWSIYFQGSLLKTQTTTYFEIDIFGYENEPPELEILGAGEELNPQSIRYPSQMKIQWYASDNAYLYRIYQLVESSWVKRTEILESGAGCYLWITPVLEDCAQSLWKVCAVDSTGNESDVVEVSFFVVRNPDAPSIEISYSSDGNLVVSEA
jgi:hypothetical protein